MVLFMVNLLEKIKDSGGYVVVFGDYGIIYWRKLERMKLLVLILFK